MNMGFLWQQGYDTKNSYLICPSSAVDDIPNGRSRDWVIIDYRRTEPTRLNSSHADYSYRPETRNSGLVNVTNYTQKAIISEDLYARYSNRRYHRELNITGFGDGSVKKIFDKSGSLFLNRIKSDRSAGYYRTSGLEEPSGVWGTLDEQY